MTKHIIILGTGGNCIDILDTIQDINDAQPKTLYQCWGFLDDKASLWGTTLHGMKVLGPLQTAIEYKSCLFVNGIGSPSNFWQKKAIIDKTSIPLDRFETIVHPSASVSRMSTLGHGVVIFQHVTITSNVNIGDHVIILPNSVISHDDNIGDYTCIAGGVCISGGVSVGRSCYLGTKCAIIGNVEIGNLCLIGMGSIVLQDVQSNSVVVGNPARAIKRTISDKL